MFVEGQTRFKVRRGKIEEMIVTRTFSEWERAYMDKLATYRQVNGGGSGSIRPLFNEQRRLLSSGSEGYTYIGYP